MLAEALQAEVDVYIAAHAAERDDNGRRLVVRNGYHQPREVLTSAGAIEVTWHRWTAICLLAYIYLAITAAMQRRQDTSQDLDAGLRSSG